MTLVSSFIDMLQQISFVMTQPTFHSFVTLLTGWVFARRRTVTGMIMAAGAVKPPASGCSQTAAADDDVKHHSAFHRVFATARWSLDELGLAVFDLILPWVGEDVIDLGIDDTPARKRGLKIFGVGMHHDPLRSTRKTAITNWGHNWVTLGVIVRLPFYPKRVFCPPILFRLYTNKKTSEKNRRRHRTRPELAVEMLRMLCKAHENRRFHAIADSAYGGKSVYLNLPANCDLTSRLALDARLYDALPERKAGQNGRPRIRGERLPTPRHMLEARCRQVTLDIYGRKDRSRVADGVARLYAMPDRPVRVVAVEPMTGGRTIQAFYSTDVNTTAEQVLTRYAMRWSIEETYQASKSHLGFEQPQGWSRKAVERTAPTAMLLYSLIVLWFAREGHRLYQAPWRPWYPGKTHPSFADMLSTLREAGIREQVFKQAATAKGRKNLVESLINIVKLAA